MKSSKGSSLLVVSLGNDGHMFEQKISSVLEEIISSSSDMDLPQLPVAPFIFRFILSDLHNKKVQCMVSAPVCSALFCSTAVRAQISEMGVELLSHLHLHLGALVFSSHSQPYQLFPIDTASGDPQCTPYICFTRLMLEESNVKLQRESAQSKQHINNCELACSYLEKQIAVKVILHFGKKA